MVGRCWVNFLCRGVLPIWIRVGQGPIVLPKGAGGGCLDIFFSRLSGRSGGAMVLGKLPVPGRPTILIRVGQGPTALAVGADGGCLDIFTLIYPLSPPSPSLWETARYRLKYCLKRPLTPNQPTNQLSSITSLFFLPLWETARYRLKYCLKRPLNPKQPTNQPSLKEREKEEER